MGGIGDWGISGMGLGRCVLGKWRRGRDKEQEGGEVSNCGISGQAAADDLCCVAAGSSRQEENCGGRAAPHTRESHGARGVFPHPEPWYL